MPAKKELDKSLPKNIEEALTMFQMEHHAAGKDGKANYGFYTTLAGGLNAVQPATHLGLSHTQTFNYEVVGDKVITILKTRLLFTGQERDYDTVIESDLVIPDLVPNRGNIMQALGSAITYARRYSLLAIYGLAGDDDDAEGSAPKEKVEQKKGISRTPTRPDSQGKKVEEIKNNFIHPAVREEVSAKLRQLKLKDEVKANQIIDDFKDRFKIKAAAFSSQHITLATHGQFLQQALAS